MMKKVVVAFVVLGILVGCQRQERDYNIEKEGLLYTINEQVSFYYPRRFELDQDDLKMSVDITSKHGDEGLYVDTYYVDSKNSPEELLSVYLTQLQTNGIDVKTNDTIQLDNGKPAFLLSGESTLSNNYFIEVVIFESNRQYVYNYIASKKIFEKHVQDMLLYLKTLNTNDLLV